MFDEFFKETEKHHKRFEDTDEKRSLIKQLPLGFKPLALLVTSPMHNCGTSPVCWSLWGSQCEE